MLILAQPPAAVVSVNRLPTVAAILASVLHAVATNGGDYWATYNFERGMGRSPEEAARIAHLAADLGASAARKPSASSAQ